MSEARMTRDFYYTGKNQCEGCGLRHGDGSRIFRSKADFEGELTEPTVRFRPEIGRVSCSDCADPKGGAASQGMLLDPDPLRMLAAL